MGEIISFIKRVSFLLFVGVLPLWPILSSLALIPLISLQIIFPSRTDHAMPLRLLWFAVPFVGFALSFGYSHDSQNAGLYLLRILPILIIPILLVFLNKDTLPARQEIKSWFLYGMLISAGFSLLLSFFSFQRTGDLGVFTYYDLAENMKLHPTYYSLYALTALHFLWNGGFKAGIKVLGTSVLLIFLLLLQSKMAYFILVLMTLLYVLIIWKSVRVRLLAVTSLIVISVMLGSKFSTRMAEDIRGFTVVDETWIGTMEENGVSQRLWLFNEAISQIKEKPIIGYGLKSQRTIFGWKVHKKGLKENQPQRYREASWTISKLNLHNQYLQVFYEGGILGLILFFVPLGMIGYYAAQIKNWFFLIPYGMFLLFLATENLLDRQMGIYYYGIFLPLLFLVKDGPIRTLNIKYNSFRS